MLKYEDIRAVHVGITNNCNASCPMCIRNVNGGPVNPNIEHEELNFEDIKTILTPEFVRQLDVLYICGNAGDAIMVKDLYESLSYIRSCNPEIILSFTTNGSGRSKEWWYKMGQLMNLKRDTVRFSIDGLEDTNHLYRVGTDFNKICESIKAFVAGGGKAVWEFIPFKHNQHQIEEAQRVAKELGCRGFQIIKSGRFAPFEATKKGDRLTWNNSHPVYSKDGDLKHIIEPPDPYYSSGVSAILHHKEAIHNYPLKLIKDVRYNRDKMYFPDIEKELEEMDMSEADNAFISCKSIQDKCIYLAESGHIFPCCWTQFQIYSMYISYDVKQIRNLLTEYGFDNIDAKKRSIKEIIEDGWFEKFSDSWKKKTIKDGKLYTCARHCTALSHVNAEYEIKEIDLKRKE